MPMYSSLTSFVFCVLCLCVSSGDAQAQELRWGYRPQKGQTLHYVKTQRMLIAGRQNDLTMEETFEILIREIDSVGSFLFNVRCVNVKTYPDSSGEPSLGSVFHGQSPLADGTFAEIAVLPNGEFVAGRFDRESEYMKKRRKGWAARGQKGPIPCSEEMLLRAICNDLFPPLYTAKALKVGTVWTDSSNYKSKRDPLDSNRILRILDEGRFPMRWVFNSVAYYGKEKCLNIVARHPNAGATDTDPEQSVVLRQDLYLRASDGLVLHHEAELIGELPNGKSYRNSVQYQLLDE